MSSPSLLPVCLALGQAEIVTQAEAEVGVDAGVGVWG